VTQNEFEPGLLKRRLETRRSRLGVPAMGVVAVSLEAGIRVAVTGERAAGSGVPVEFDDPWHLGSNSKALSAVLIVRLVRQGHLSWEDGIAPVLGRKVDRIARGWGKVGLRQLLGHCAGMRTNASTFTLLKLTGGGNRDGPADRLRYAEDVLRRPPFPVTDDQAEYSNAGYVVAGAMAEVRTGRPWRELMRTEVFQPLGLASAGFGPPGSRKALDAPRGHSPSWFGLGPPRPEKPDWGADNPPALDPAGRIHMSMADYGTFLLDQLEGLRGSGRILPEEDYRLLHSPVCNPAMALGWALSESGEPHHAGSNGMWYIEAALHPRQGTAVAVASNDGRVEHQRPAVLRLMAEIRNDLSEPG
jgi:D-alanyl-D-alanine carboxypeptidase